MNPVLHIRKTVFRLTQAEMATIANVTQGTVSKWETSDMRPGHVEMANIRKAAVMRGISWDDSWFFESPAEADQ